MILIASAQAWQGIALDVPVAFLSLIMLFSQLIGVLGAIAPRLFPDSTLTEIAPVSI